MSDVQLNIDECVGGGLPANCVYCGAATTEVTMRRMSAGGQKQVMVALPMCASNCHYGKSPHRQLAAWLGVGMALLYVVGYAVVVGMMGILRLNGFFKIAILFIWLGSLGVSALGIAALLRGKPIRAKQIAQRTITLTNVSPAFISALEKYRQEQRPFDLDRVANTRWNDGDSPTKRKPDHQDRLSGRRDGQDDSNIVSEDDDR
jgi:uncharacterized membrane protein (Fun14 family)